MLCFSAVAPAIDGMMLAGKWIGSRGNFQKSIIESALYCSHREEADKRFADLLVRAGIR
jgi:hypothetical protein